MPAAAAEASSGIGSDDDDETSNDLGTIIRHPMELEYGPEPDLMPAKAQTPSDTSVAAGSVCERAAVATEAVNVGAEAATATIAAEPETEPEAGTATSTATEPAAPPPPASTDPDALVEVLAALAHESHAPTGVKIRSEYTPPGKDVHIAPAIAKRLKDKSKSVRSLGGYVVEARVPSRNLMRAFKGKIDGDRGLPTLSQQETRVFKALRSRLDGAFVSDLLATDILLVRCLCARKWDIEAAEGLATNYVNLLCPTVEPPTITSADVLLQLQTGALAATGGTDLQGAAMLEFVASRYNRHKHAPMDVLKTILYLVECCHGVPATLRNGVALLIDFRDIRYSQLDSASLKLFLDTVQTRYPVRITAIHILSNTWLVWAVVTWLCKSLSKAVKEKVQVHTSLNTVHNKVFPDQLTASFGGTLDYSHERWINGRIDAEGVAESVAVEIEAQKTSLIRRFSVKDIERARKAVARCKAYASPTKTGVTV